MNPLWTLARKDLLVLARDRLSLFWMFGMPLLFAGMFGAMFGGGGPGKSNPLRVAVVSDGLDEAGRRFAQRLDASDALEVEELPRDAAIDAVRRGDKLAYLEIVRAPANDLAMFAGESPELAIGIDPSRTAETGLLRGLVTEATFAGFRDLFTDPAKSRAQLQRLAARVRDDRDLPVVQRVALTTFFGAFDTFLGTQGLGAGAGGIEPRIAEVAVARARTGPPNAFSLSFPQSILWGLIGCAAGFAITMVRERSNGTLVRLLTAPLAPGTLLAGKALACAISCVGVVAVLTTVGVVGFGVQVGSVPLLVLATASAAACFAGLSMLLSSLGRTEQAASGLAWGLLLVAAMFGGGMVPQIAMPGWMLAAGAWSPARWTIQALEGAIWRGFSFGEMALPCAVLLAIGGATLALGVVRLRRS